jgi:CBS domain containing-hemolysin-like protein
VTQLRWQFPREYGVETLAGFLLVKLGHIPEEGETVEFEGRRFAVVKMEGQRIAQVRVDPIEEQELQEGEEPPVTRSQEMAGGRR